MQNNMSQRVFKAMSIFSGVQFVNILTAIVRAKFIVLWMGAVGVGLFTVFNNVLTTLLTLSQLGLRNSAVRDISQATPATFPRTVHIVRRLSLWLGLAGMALMILCSPWLSLAYFEGYDHTLWFALLAPAVLLSALIAGEQAIFQGTRRFKLMANTGVLTAVGGTLLSLPVYYFFRLDSFVPAILIFTFVGWIGIHLWRVRTPMPESAIGAKRVWNDGRAMLSLGIYMTASTFVTQGVSLLFISYLTAHGGLDEVGYFQSGFTIVNQYVGLIFTAISMEYYPRLAAAAHSPRAMSLFVSHETVLVLALLAGIGSMFIVCNRLVIYILYDSSFDCITPFITLAMIGTVFKCVSWCVAMVILAKGDGRTYIITESVSSLIYLGVNIIAYNLAGIAGMGYAYIIWFLCYLTIVYIVYRWRYGYKLSRGAWLMTIAVSAALTLTVILYNCFGEWGAAPVALVCMVGTLMCVGRLLRGRKATADTAH